jgi:hypothetical protein
MYQEFEVGVAIHPSRVQPTLVGAPNEPLDSSMMLPPEEVWVLEVTEPATPPFGSKVMVYAAVPPEIVMFALAVSTDPQPLPQSTKVSLTLYVPFRLPAVKAPRLSEIVKSPDEVKAS